LYDLAQDSQSWLFSDYLKKLKASFFLLIAPSFLRMGARVLPLLALFFRFWIKVMDPCFILSYDPVDKIRFFS
jgi:hypothetical protein